MDNIMALARNLYRTQVLRFNDLRERAGLIIKLNNTDVNLIEHTLDDILDVYYFLGTKEVEDVYWLLCDYLKAFDLKSAEDYMNFLSEAKKENDGYVIH